MSEDERDLSECFLQHFLSHSAEKMPSFSGTSARDIFMLTTESQDQFVMKVMVLWMLL